MANELAKAEPQEIADSGGKEYGTKDIMDGDAARLAQQKIIDYYGFPELAILSLSTIPLAMTLVVLVLTLLGGLCERTLYLDYLLPCLKIIGGIALIDAGTAVPALIRRRRDKKLLKTDPLFRAEFALAKMWRALQARDELALLVEDGNERKEVESQLAEYRKRLISQTDKFRGLRNKRDCFQKTMQKADLRILGKGGFDPVFDAMLEGTLIAGKRVAEEEEMCLAERTENLYAELKA